MRNIAFLAGAAIASNLSLQAAEVYSTDFGVSDEYTQNTGGVVFDNGTTTGVEEWFGSTNGVGIGSGTLSFGNTSENRFRGSGVWLDATGWEAGLVSVEFDVTSFTAGADSSFVFQAYGATGVDASNTVSLDLHGAAATEAQTSATGSASITSIGSGQTITAAGTDLSFSFNYNGTDQFVALTFAQINASGGTAFGTATLDNLTVNAAIPEPGTYALLAGLTGLAFVMLRRRA